MTAISVSFILPFCAWLPAQTAAPAQPADRPNILVAIADDWSWPHAGVYGDKVIKTPTFDRLASDGVLFSRAFCATASCMASRAGLLTGQAIHRLEEGGNLWSTLPKKFDVYPDLLEAAGYTVGFTGKGCAPGNVRAGGRKRNAAGPPFKNFEEFLKDVPAGKPFCFWFGSHDPHRPYKEGSGRESGMKIEDVVVPPFLPDTPEVRSDILDYYFAVQRFDRDLGNVIKSLEASGRLDNTLIVVTSDNGMPFPRGKSTTYDAGMHMPLAVCWRGKIKGGRTAGDLVSFTDFAPTFLEAAGLKVPAAMTGRSLLGLLTGKPGKAAESVFFERERHANSRRGDLSYPSRAIRTNEFLYIRNLRPDRWPAGDPKKHVAVGPFGDIDDSPTKRLLLEKRDDPQIGRFFRLACDKRPAEELYDLKTDPWQLKNVADEAAYAEAKKKLRAALDRWQKDTADPLLTSDDEPWDHYPYYGGPPAPR